MQRVSCNKLRNREQKRKGWGLELEVPIESGLNPSCSWQLSDEDAETASLHLSRDAGACNSPAAAVEKEEEEEEEGKKEEEEEEEGDDNFFFLQWDSQYRNWAWTYAILFLVLSWFTTENRY